MKRGSRGQAVTGEMMAAALLLTLIYFAGIGVIHGAKWIYHETGAAVHHVFHRATHHPFGITPKSEKQDDK